MSIRRRYFSIIILILLLILAFVKYTGLINIEDVFNGQYKYVGQTLNSKADGFGKKYTLDDILIYEGYFVSNSYDGHGKYYFYYDQDDSVVTRLRYDGDFKEGVYQGSGKKYYAAIEDMDENGKDKPCLMYEGEFADSQYSGDGTYYGYKQKADVGNSAITSDEKYYLSSKYIGQWSDGNRDGNGCDTIYNEDGAVIERYTGDFSEDSYDGEGIWEFIDKSENDYGKVVYSGQIVNNKISGDGVFYRSDGSVISIKSESGMESQEVLEKYLFPEDNIWAE